MNKKVIIPIVVVLIITIGIAAFLFLNKKGSKEPVIDTDNMAEELDPYIDTMDKDEIKDVLDSEMTDGQKEAFQDALDTITLPENIDVNSDGKLVVKDEDGNEQLIEHPHQDVLDGTDEEAEEDFAKIQEELQAIINSKEDRPTNPNKDNTSSNITTQPGNNTENNTGVVQPSTEPNTDGWDQGFYDTLTPEQQEIYKNLSDESSRNQMKNNILNQREREANGWTVDHGDPTEEDLKNAWSHIQMGG